MSGRLAASSLFARRLIALTHMSERGSLDLELERASASINELIERRAAERQRANWEADLWKNSEERLRARERERNRAAWYGYYSRLADAHAELSEEFARRAEQLCETGSGQER